MTHLRTWLAAAAVAGAVGAQTLTLNGQTGAVNCYMGVLQELRLQGPPGASTAWGFNIDGGPTQFGSLSVPIGFTPNLIDLMGGAPMPPSGEIVLPFVFPFAPSLAGLVVYSVAGFADATAPEGVVITNGLVMTLALHAADAGADGATLVGKPVTLDGSDNAGLPAGNAPQWTVVAAPVGSAAVLDHAGTAFPTFTPDLPGSYTIELAYVGPDGAAIVPDATIVDVYDLVVASPVDGSFGSGTFAVNGTVAGPALAGLTVNGAATPVVGGAFNAGTLSPAAVGASVPVTIEATSPSGAKVAKTVVRLTGSAQPIASPALPAAGVRANGVSLDPLEPFVQQALASIDFSTLIASIPPITLANQVAPFPPGFVIFSAIADPTGFTYDPTVVVDFAPGTNCGVSTTLTFTNVVITIDVTGKILNAPYLSTVTINAASASTTGDLVFVQGANGLETQMQNATATLTGFTFTVTGPLASFSGLAGVQALIQSTVEAALAGALQLLPPIVNPLLTQFNQQTFDLSAQGIPLSVGFPLASFCYDAVGVTAGFGLTLVPQPPVGVEVPTLVEYRTTPGALPVFGATTPVLALPYTAATALNDDAINVLFATFAQLGVLNLDVDTQLGVTPLTAGALASVLPGAGFEAFDAAAPVVVAVRHTTAPSVEVSQAGPTQGALHLAGVVLRFGVDTGLGFVAPVFDASLSASAGLAFSVDPTTGAVTLTPSNVVSAVAAGGNFPGGDVGASLTALNALVAPLVTQLAGLLSAVPLPAAGGAVVEVSITGDNLVVYF